MRCSRSAAGCWKVPTGRLPSGLLHALALNPEPLWRTAVARSCSQARADSVVLSAEKLRAEILRSSEGGSPSSLRTARGLGILDDALRMLGPEGLVVAFNGGKDATVVLHLARAAMAGWGKGRRPLKTVYLPSDDEFPEVDAFVHSTSSSLPDIDFRVLHGGLRVGLEEMCSEVAESLAADAATVAGHRICLGFVLGTKKNDPNAWGQGKFEPSSSKFPPFWRVNPILDWSYAEVWDFLRNYGLPYCEMYDRGYTSIGQRSRTLPNPVLESGDGSYLPAYELSDDSLERAGRASHSHVVPVEVAPSVPLSGRTCGLVVIGNEVLKGLTSDRNSAEAVKQLRALGVSLQRIAVVPDSKEAIAAEICRQSDDFDFVITSGGIGPTHDDVTLHAVGMAFSMPLSFPDKDERFMELLQISNDNDRVLLTTSQRQLAKFPTGHALRWIEGREWPVLQVRNVFVLPGVPEDFRSSLRAVLSFLVKCPGNRPPFRRLQLAVCESEIAGFVRQVARSMPHVTFGSYPTAGGGTTITIESESEAAVSLATQSLLDGIPDTAVVSIDSHDEV